DGAVARPDRERLRGEAVEVRLAHEAMRRKEEKPALVARGHRDQEKEGERENGEDAQDETSAQPELLESETGRRRGGGRARRRFPFRTASVTPAPRPRASSAPRRRRTSSARSSRSTRASPSGRAPSSAPSRRGRLLLLASSSSDGPPRNPAQAPEILSPSSFGRASRSATCGRESPTGKVNRPPSPNKPRCEPRRHRRLPKRPERGSRADWSVGPSEAA